MKKPKVKLIGQDGNVFNLIGICRKALNQVGMKNEAIEMSKEILSSKSYNEALVIMMKYCNVK